MSAAYPVQQQETAQDFGSGEGAKAQRWISEIDLAKRSAEDWRQRCKKIIERYAQNEKGEVKNRRFALFWSNVETLKPAVLARVPAPVVSRRNKDEDPTGRVASEVLERALGFICDVSDIAAVFTAVRDDLLLVAKGTAWCRYVPHMVTKEPNGDVAVQTPTGQVSDGGEPYEVVGWEEAVADHVSWDDFLHNPARKWAEVRWVGRRVYMTRDELVTRFGAQKGKMVPLDHAPEDYSGPETEKEQWKKATVWEVWDKPSRKAIWICPSCPDYPLDERPDPLKLQDFFPCPRPVMGTTGGSLNPTPDYIFYESQCKDIDDLSARIGKLTEALKLRGFYAAGGQGGKDLKNLFAEANGTLIPIDSWAAFAESGGVKGLIEWVPLDMVVTALKGCIEARKQLIEDVYQVTGIADIMRGDTDPNETAAAQQLKSSWGSSRVRDRQKELARFSRDVIRILGQIIATKFSPETLGQMTNVKLLPTLQAKAALQQQLQAQAAQAQMMAQHATQTGQQPPPPFQPPAEAVAMLQRPTWEEVCGLLQDNTLRAFRIDIETDSTIEPNDQEEKQRRVEFVTAVGKFMAEALPILNLAPQMAPVLMEGLKFLVRGFRVGREMEEVIDKALDQLQQGGLQQPQQGPQADPQVEQAKAQAAGMQAQASVTDAQTRQFQAQTDRGAAITDAQLRAQEIQAENARTSLDRHAELHMHGKELMQQAVDKAAEREATREMSDSRPIRADTQ